MVDQTLPGQELGRKLSVASFGFDKGAIQELVLKDRNAPCFLVRVIGTATDTKSYVSRAKNEQGEQMEGYGLRGQFDMIGPDGEIKSGNLLYLPAFVTDAIVAALQAGEGDVACDIGLDIYAQYDNDSATSYVFSVRSLIPENRAAVDRVRQLVAGALLPSSPSPAKASK